MIIEFHEHEARRWLSPSSSRMCILLLLIKPNVSTLQSFPVGSTDFLPEEAFRWVHHVFTVIHQTEPVDFRIVGFLGRTAEVRVGSVDDIEQVWKKWYTQALQARAATLQQKLLFPLG